MPNRLGRLWERAADWIVVIVVAAAFIVGCWGIWAIHETHQIVAGHDTELAQTKSLAEQIKADVQSQNKQNEAFNKAAQAVETYAAQLLANSSDNHSQTLTELGQICNAIPGCHIQQEPNG